jgi:hypothetical protein
VFGIIFGTICLIALFKVSRRHWGYSYAGHRCGPGESGGWRRFDCGDDREEARGEGGFFGHHHRGGFRSVAHSWFLRRIFDALEATPTQQSTIRSAVEEFATTAESLKDGWKKARAETAQAVRAAQLDDKQLHDAFSSQDQVFERVRAAGVALLTRVHSALDERQRQRLADLIESGRFWGWM